MQQQNIAPELTAARGGGGPCLLFCHRLQAGKPQCISVCSVVRCGGQRTCVVNRVSGQLATRSCSQHALQAHVERRHRVGVLVQVPAWQAMACAVVLVCCAVQTLAPSPSVQPCSMLGRKQIARASRHVHCLHCLRAASPPVNRARCTCTCVPHLFAPYSYASRRARQCASNAPRGWRKTARTSYGGPWLNLWWR